MGSCCSRRGRFTAIYNWRRLYLVVKKHRFWQRIFHCVGLRLQRGLTRTFLDRLSRRFSVGALMTLAFLKGGICARDWMDGSIRKHKANLTNILPGWMNPEAEGEPPEYIIQDSIPRLKENFTNILFRLDGGLSRCRRRTSRIVYSCMLSAQCLQRIQLCFFLGIRPLQSCWEMCLALFSNQFVPRPDASLTVSLEESRSLRAPSRSRSGCSGNAGGLKYLNKEEDRKAAVARSVVADCLGIPFQLRFGHRYMHDEH